MFPLKIHYKSHQNSVIYDPWPSQIGNNTRPSFQWHGGNATACFGRWKRPHLADFLEDISCYIWFFQTFCWEKYGKMNTPILFSIVWISHKGLWYDSEKIPILDRFEIRIEKNVAVKFQDPDHKNGVAYIYIYMCVCVYNRRFIYIYVCVCV